MQVHHINICKMNISVKLNSIKEVDAAYKLKNTVWWNIIKQIIYWISMIECSTLVIIVMAVYQDVLDRYFCVTRRTQRTVCPFEPVRMSVSGMPYVKSGKDPFFMAWQSRVEHIWQCRQSSMKDVINFIPRYLPYPPDSFPYPIACLESLCGCWINATSSSATSRANLAFRSADSLPLMPTWLAIQQRWISLSFSFNWCSRLAAHLIYLLSKCLCCIDWREDSEWL